MRTTRRSKQKENLFASLQQKAELKNVLSFFVTKLVDTLKGKKGVRDKLTQCNEMRADEGIRKAALARNDKSVTRFGCS